MNLKSYNDQLTLEKLKSNYQGNTRVGYIAQPLFYQTSAPMGVQSALFDILRLSSKIPKLFCTSLYGSRVICSKAYKTTSTNIDTVSRDLRIHEPYSGFSFIKELYKNGMIEVDNTTHEILRLSGEKYASVLEERYGKSVLKHSAWL